MELLRGESEEEYFSSGASPLIMEGQIIYLQKR